MNNDYNNREFNPKSINNQIARSFEKMRLQCEKPIIINDVYYPSLVIAACRLGVSNNSVSKYAALARKSKLSGIEATIGVPTKFIFKKVKES